MDNLIEIAANIINGFIGFVLIPILSIFVFPILILTLPLDFGKRLRDNYENIILRIFLFFLIIILIALFLIGETELFQHFEGFKTVLEMICCEYCRP